MILTISGFAVGILLGLIFPGIIPKQYSVYLGIALLSAIDSIVGAINAKLNKTYNAKIFLSGFIINSILAVGLILLGKLLGLDFSLAALVVFGTRLFSNFAAIRRNLLNIEDKK